MFNLVLAACILTTGSRTISSNWKECVIRISTSSSQPKKLRVDVVFPQKLPLAWKSDGSRSIWYHERPGDRELLQAVCLTYRSKKCVVRIIEVHRTSKEDKPNYLFSSSVPDVISYNINRAKLSGLWNFSWPAGLEVYGRSGTTDFAIISNRRIDVRSMFPSVRLYYSRKSTARTNKRYDSCRSRAMGRPPGG